MPRIVTLKKRAEFLRLRGGQRWSNTACVVETKPSPAGPRARRPAVDGAADEPSDWPRGGADQEAGDIARFGFTITKQVGNAVVRNKLRRRLRAIVGQLPADTARAGNDYVIVLRPAAAELSFADLSSQVTEAVARVHRASARRSHVRPAQSRERRR